MKIQIILTSVLLFGVFYGAQAVAGVSVSAGVVAIATETEVEGQGALEINDTVKVGDHITTSSKGSVTLLLNDESILTLGPNTRATIAIYDEGNAEHPGKSMIHVVEGTFRFIPGAILSEGGAQFVGTKAKYVGESRSGWKPGIGGSISVTKTPDTLSTPVAVPYPDGKSLANKTKTGTKFGKSVGDEAGYQGGVVSSKYTKKAEFKQYSMSVVVEGEKNQVRSLDTPMHNGLGDKTVDGDVYTGSVSVAGTTIPRGKSLSSALTSAMSAISAQRAERSSIASEILQGMRGGSVEKDVSHRQAKIESQREQFAEILESIAEPEDIESADSITRATQTKPIGSVDDAPSVNNSPVFENAPSVVNDPSVNNEPSVDNEPNVPDDLLPSVYSGSVTDSNVELVEENSEGVVISRNTFNTSDTYGISVAGTTMPGASVLSSVLTSGMGSQSGRQTERSSAASENLRRFPGAVVKDVLLRERSIELQRAQLDAVLESFDKPVDIVRVDNITRATRSFRTFETRPTAVRPIRGVRISR